MKSVKKQLKVDLRDPALPSVDSDALRLSDKVRLEVIEEVSEKVPDGSTVTAAELSKLDTRRKTPDKPDNK